MIAAVDVVVKVGGSLLADPPRLDAVLGVLADASPERRLLVVPGGGPFADAVREVDRRVGLTDTAAHWMAVLAMDQYGHLLAARLPGSVVVSEPREMAAALDSRRLPVLVPFRWLRQTDPLPHGWDVTSDSIAAWTTGAIGADRLVLVKPAGAHGHGLVDAYFDRALPAGVTAAIVPADRLDALRTALGRRPT